MFSAEYIIGSSTSYTSFIFIKTHDIKSNCQQKPKNLENKFLSQSINNETTRNWNNPAANWFTDNLLFRPPVIPTFRIFASSFFITPRVARRMAQVSVALNKYARRIIVKILIAERRSLYRKRRNVRRWRSWAPTLEDSRHNGAAKRPRWSGERVPVFDWKAGKIAIVSGGR